MTANADGLRRRIIDRYTAVAADAATQLQQALQNAAPLGQTGDTRRRTTAALVQEPTLQTPTARIEARADTEYASFTDEGTPPHQIRPRNATVLRFVIPGRGVVFATLVNHPGINPTTYEKIHWFSETLRGEFTPALRRASDRA